MYWKVNSQTVLTISIDYQSKEKTVPIISLTITIVDVKLIKTVSQQSHTWMWQSALEATSFPSLEKSADVTPVPWSPLLCPTNVIIIFPDPEFQIITVWSSEQERIRLSSGEKLHSFTAALWPADIQ